MKLKEAKEENRILCFRDGTMGGTVARLKGRAGDSSYSAASKSWRCAPLKNLGRMYCLTGIKSIIIRGNRTPAIGIHVIPKQTAKYNAWKMVKSTMVLKGTVSTKVAW